MAPHVKTYLDFWKLTGDGDVLCDYCGGQANDIHHIIFRSQGGTDTIENLIALCRKHHDEAHKNKLTDDDLADCLIHKAMQRKYT